MLLRVQLLWRCRHTGYRLPWQAHREVQLFKTRQLLRCLSAYSLPLLCVVRVESLRLIVYVQGPDRCFRLLAKKVQKLLKDRTACEMECVGPVKYRSGFRAYPGAGRKQGRRSRRDLEGRRDWIFVLKARR